MAFDKRLLKYALPIPEDIEMHDWWIGLVASCMGKTVFIHDSYLLYRRHGDNTSSLKHYPLKKMISNRLYFIQQLRLRKKQVEWHV